MPRVINTTTTTLFALLALLILPTLAAPLRFRRADSVPDTSTGIGTGTNAIVPRDLGQPTHPLTLRQIAKVIFEGRAGPGPVPAPPSPPSGEPKIAARLFAPEPVPVPSSELGPDVDGQPKAVPREVPAAGQGISLRALGKGLLDKVEQRAGYVPPQGRRSPPPAPDPEPTSIPGPGTETPKVSLREVGTTFLEKLERRAGYVPPKTRRGGKSRIAADKW